MTRDFIKKLLYKRLQCSLLNKQKTYFNKGCESGKVEGKTKHSCKFHKIIVCIYIKR